MLNYKSSSGFNFTVQVGDRNKEFIIGEFSEEDGPGVELVMIMSSEGYSGSASSCL